VERGVTTGIKVLISFLLLLVYLSLKLIWCSRDR